MRHMQLLCDVTSHILLVRLLPALGNRCSASRQPLVGGILGTHGLQCIVAVLYCFARLHAH